MFYYPSAAPTAKPAPQAPVQAGAWPRHQFRAGQATTFTDEERRVPQSGSRSPEDTGTTAAEDGVGVPDPRASQSLEHPIPEAS